MPSAADQLCRCSCCGTFQTAVQTSLVQADGTLLPGDPLPVSRCTSCGQYLSHHEHPLSGTSGVPADRQTPIRSTDASMPPHSFPRTFGEPSNSTWWWCSPAPRRRFAATDDGNPEGNCHRESRVGATEGAGEHPLPPPIPGTTVAVVSSPSIVFRGRAGSQRSHGVSVDATYDSPVSGGHRTSGTVPTRKGADNRSGRTPAAGMSSVERVLQAMRPKNDPVGVDAHRSRPAQGSASPVRLQRDAQPQQSVAAVTAAAASMTRSLLALNNQRLTQRYYNKWLIVSRSRMPKSVIKMRRGPVSASPGGLSSRAHGAPEWSVSRSSVSPTRPTNEVLHSAVTALWKAHEDHAACVKAVLDRLVSTAEGDEVATPFFDTRTAGQDASLPARSTQSTAGVIPSPVAADPSDEFSSPSSGSPRPLAALIRMQGAHALTYLQRNEEVARRRLLQAEVEDRDALELEFHSEREVCSKPGRARRQMSGSLASSGSRTASEVLRSFDVQLASAKQEAASSPSPTRPVPIAAANRVGKDTVVDATVLAARESNARKLLVASQSNAWVTVLAALETAYREARQQDAERSILRREASAAYGAKIGTMAAVGAWSPPAATTTPATSSPLSLRQRSSTMRTAITSESPPPSPATVSESSAPAAPAVAAASASPLRAERSAAYASPELQPGEGRLRRSQTVVVASPRSSLAASQDVAAAQPPVAQILSDELRGRKQVVKLYKEGMAEIISFFANRASVL